MKAKPRAQGRRAGSAGPPRAVARRSKARPRAGESGPPLQSRFHFASGLRFDLLYSLEVLLNPAARIHSGWKRETIARLLRSAREDLRYFEESARFWVFVGDALGGASPPEDMPALRKQLEAIDPERFRYSILEGALHDSAAVRRIARGEITLARALLETPAEKREWLEHIELYPPGLNSPTLRALTRVAESPAEAKARVLRVLDAYWRSSFEETWASLQAPFARSAAEKERLLQSCTLEEFFRVALLRVEADESAKCLRALRGGYTLPYERIRKVFVMPSAFNHHRFWTAFEEKDGVVVFLPYFDASVALDVAGAAAAPGPAHADVASGAAAPEVDAPLILKALGDPTRFAMATLIARTPMTSADLAARLALSRPTISHHVVLLREAGLLREESAGGSVVLHLRREPLAALSDALLQKLVPQAGGAAADAQPLALHRRRGPGPKLRG